MRSKEVWRDVVGFEKYYAVSSNGNVKRKCHVRNSRNQYGSYLKKYSEKMLNLGPDKDGYLLVVLSMEGGNRYTKKVHRLVAEAFLGDCNGRIVNHKNCKKDDNRLTNLEWCSILYNNMYTDKYTKRKRGVTKAGSKWQSQLKYDNESFYLGRFEEKEDAYEAYFKKYKELTGDEPW